MVDRPRFGPAGVPPAFRLMKAALEDVPRLLFEEQLDAFEYEAIYWGSRPQMKEVEAERLGLNAIRYDVRLSMHGSYFVNLCGEKPIVEASKKRLIACAVAAGWMKAYVLVFHPGFYGRKTPRQAYSQVVVALREIVATMRGLGVNEVRLGAETMGKKSQFGTLEEIISLLEDVEQTQLVIDWSHLHARSGGRLKSVDEFREIVEHIENRLGKEHAENMHCHFTKIEFSNKGERRHHVLDESHYGPDFGKLAQVIADFKLKPIVICESPLLDIDALKMKDIFAKTLVKSAHTFSA